MRQAKQTMEPLKKKLTGKYGSIFMITEKGIEVKDGMERLLNKDRTEARTTDSTPRFTATITITKGDLSSVQSFLWSLMQKTAQDNFGFQQLDSQATLKSPIKVNVYDAHFSIVQTTFKFLADPPNKKTQTFGEYLMAWLPDHLKKLEEAKGLDELTPAQKQFIGDGVFALVDDDTIIRHWESSRRVTFFRSAGEVQVFRRWLSDPVAICSLRRREREWLEEVRRDRNPNQALLKGVTKLVAHGWMRAREWDVARPLEWIRGYLAMVSFTRATTAVICSISADGHNSQPRPRMNLLAMTENPWKSLKSTCRRWLTGASRPLA